MGLLDGNLDPQTMASLQLAGGLLSPGSFGQGLSRGIAGYQGSMAGSQEMQLRQQQILAAQQEQKIKDIQLQQSTRMFDLQTPFLEQAVARMRGQAPGGAAPMASPGVMPTDGMGSAPSQQSSQPQQAQQPQQGGGSMFPGVNDEAAFGVIGTGGFAKLPEMIMKANEPTELVKTMRQAGIDPNSALGRQYLQSNLAKTNYIAPLNSRVGAIVRDPITQQPIAFNPQIPEGSAPHFDASGNVISVGPIDGVLPAVGALARAKAGGEGSVLPYAGVGANGQPLPVTNRTAAATQGDAPIPVRSAASTPPEPSRTGSAASIQAQIDMVRSNGGQPITAAMKPAIDREVRDLQNQLLRANSGGGSIYASAPLGAAEGAKNAQDTMTGSFRSVMAANSSAQTVQARLSSINQLASSAITGGETEYRDAANNLLSIAFPGDVGKQATDRKTAGDLIDKNAAQIALAIGAGSNGTDALRSLAAASNPGRKMTPQAITEAVAQLQGSAQIQQAKASLLTPLFTSGDPSAYVKAEQEFDKNADYRIFQLKNMNPQQAALYLAKMPKQEQDELRSKAAALKTMKVF